MADLKDGVLYFYKTGSGSGIRHRFFTHRFCGRTNWAIRSQIEQVKAVAKTVKNHWNGILTWFESKLSTGFLEAINGLVQSAKRRARGYRSTKNLINMAYLIAGKLDFRLPT